MHKDRDIGPSEGQSGWGWLLLGIVVLLTLLPLFLLYIGPFLNDVASIELKDHFDGGTIVGKFMLNGKWIIYLMLGILFGTLHRSSKGLVGSGIEEWREWKLRHGRRNMKG